MPLARYRAIEGALRERHPTKTYTTTWHTTTSGHLSSSRPLHPVELDQISHDARWRIVTTAANALGFDVEREHLIRVGHVSDGSRSESLLAGVRPPPTRS
jgi:hypothetical protein